MLARGGPTKKGIGITNRSSLPALTPQRGVRRDDAPQAERHFIRARSASAAMKPKAAHCEPATTRLKIAFARSVSPFTR